MTQINCRLDTSPLMKIFYHCYLTWCDYQNFYQTLNKESTPQIRPRIVSESSQDAINCHWVRNVTKIYDDPSPVVFIDNLTECINSKNFFRHYPRDKYYVIFSNGYWEDDFYDLPFRYSQVYYPYYLLENTHKYLSHNRFMFNLNKTYDFNYPKKYSFVGTAGSPRPEKNGFINRFVAGIKHKNFVLKFGREDLGEPYHDPHVELFPDKFDSNNSLPGGEKHFFTLSDTLPLDLYNQGYFNLLLEGDIGWTNQFHISEKTIKTLVTGMPFVMVSSPHFLKGLKEMGFMTYSDLWDESYDDINDYAYRMERIVELCNELYTFDWAKHQEKIKYIALHNRSVFFDFHKIVDKSFRQFESVLDSIPVDIERFKIQA